MLIGIMSMCLGSVWVKADGRLPESPMVVDVTRPPYSAKGNGVVDDTEALQRALNENVGRNRAVFLPKGTYLVSRTLTWPKRWNGRENWGMTIFRGESRDGTVLRLKDQTFTNSAQPGAIMWCGGFGSADWFHNYVECVTFDASSGNPGATGLQFYSNNSGAVRDCRFVAREGSGAVGLDLAHRDMNGPLLVRRCEVSGFRRGVATGHSVNSQTFEHLTLRGQSEFGFDNQGQFIALRGLVSDNSVPAVRSYGTFCLLDATVTGDAGAAAMPAVVNYNGGRIMLRNVTTRGYARTLADVASPDFAAALRVRGADKPGSEGPKVEEYFSQQPTRPFPTMARPPRLAIKETPDPPEEPPASWANVDSFGADPTGSEDSSRSIQSAIDSGATTVFMPGSYKLRSTVTIRGAVRRIVGLGGAINYGAGLKPDLRLADGEEPAVFLEHLSHVGGGIEIASQRTLILRSVSDCDLIPTSKAEGGEIFCEDVVTHRLTVKRQRVWARQLNIENEGVHLTNDAGQLWVLGYKTERGGTLLEARGGSRSEILGNFSYTTTAGKQAPMFINRDSDIFAFFGEVCYNGDPFSRLVEETWARDCRIIRRGEGHTLPYIGGKGSTPE